MTDENSNTITEENIDIEPQNNDGAIDDVIIESDDTLDDSVLAEESMQETVKKLREKLKLATKEKQEYLDGWQRTNGIHIYQMLIAGWWVFRKLTILSLDYIM